MALDKAGDRHALNHTPRMLTSTVEERPRGREPLGTRHASVVRPLERQDELGPWRVGRELRDGHRAFDLLDPPHRKPNAMRVARITPSRLTAPWPMMPGTVLLVR